jgi:hypothetical protein
MDGLGCTANAKTADAEQMATPSRRLVEADGMSHPFPRGCF